MKLSFKYAVKKISKEQEEIVKDLEWHTKKVMNMLLYDIKEKKEIIDERKNINIIATPIYRRYREENWHSKYLHSHMLLEAIMSVIGSYKSYIARARDSIYKVCSKDRRKYNKIIDIKRNAREK